MQALLCRPGVSEIIKFDGLYITTEIFLGRVEAALKGINAAHNKRIKQGKPDQDYDPPIIVFDGLMEFLRNMDDTVEANVLLDVVSC